MSGMKKILLVMGISMMAVLAGCGGSREELNVDAVDVENLISENIADSQDAYSEDGKENNKESEQVESDREADVVEEVWYRTEVPAYAKAEIRISNWKEGESFDVVLYAEWGDSSAGYIRGTANFLDDTTAVLYDEGVEARLREFYRPNERYTTTYADLKDSGFYFEFTGDSIIVTHDAQLNGIFGGGVCATAAGTYIQGEPDYTSCSDIAELFSEDELDALQELLGDRFVPLVKDVIEVGRLEEISIENGRLWKVDWIPNKHAWCNIVMYDNGDIYIEGLAYGMDEIEFYTNSGNGYMPAIDALKPYAGVHESSGVELYDGDVMSFLETVTDDMLLSCDEEPDYWGSFLDDPIVFLSKYNDEIRVYGIRTAVQEKILLWVQGERFVIDERWYYSAMAEPELNYSDIDSDGVKEIIIMIRRYPGLMRRYEIIVYDYDGTWNAYSYDDYEQDFDENIHWEYDQTGRTVTIMDREGNTLRVLKLPAWMDYYPLTGDVEYDSWLSLDMEAMQFKVTPGFLHQNSGRYSPVDVVIDVIYKDGEFELGDYYVQDSYFAYLYH